MLPELTEAEAKGGIASVYVDIRDTMGIPQVNLIYRYFATIDGALPAIWDFLRPYFVRGDISNAVGEFSTLLTPKALAQYTLPPSKLDADKRLAINATLDFYIRANPMNLCALQLLTLAIDDCAEIKLNRPPLLGAEELQLKLAHSIFEQRVDELMYAVSQGAAHIRPTLLRQLQQWPDFLEMVSPMIKSICVDATFFSLSKTVYDAAMKKSRLMLNNERLALSPTARDEVLAFCQYFPVLLIRMTMIAKIMRNAASSEK